MCACHDLLIRLGHSIVHDRETMVDPGSESALQVDHINAMGLQNAGGDGGPSTALALGHNGLADIDVSNPLHQIAEKDVMCLFDVSLFPLRVGPHIDQTYLAIDDI